ncbi:hypothetical protein M0804_014368 [Polistes exclamans]|nr:hypothetical protein M0804_014371 [Polistes exclamans]KAI4475337.1 hypothetical protein M0804_014368 [Polistes exclamans]
MKVLTNKNELVIVLFSSDDCFQTNLWKLWLLVFFEILPQEVEFEKIVECILRIVDYPNKEVTVLKEVVKGQTTYFHFRILYEEEEEEEEEKEMKKKKKNSSTNWRKEKSI